MTPKIDDTRGDCPGRNVLRALLARSLESAEEKRTVDHVESCAKCQDQLEELVKPTPTGIVSRQDLERAGQLSTLDGRDSSSAGDGCAPAPNCIPGIRLSHCIARGGMGAVYSADQLAPVARKVAVKFVRPDRLDRDLLRRFQQERSLLASIDHPNVAHLFEAGQLASGEPYFVMEFVDGETIAAYCSIHSVDLGSRLSLFLQVCEAIQCLHTRQIVHRDIKPSNILVRRVGESPQVKIIDFGLAKQLWIDPRRGGDRTLDGQPIGTLRYMSPEQTGSTGRKHSVDARTDVYSLGVLLYELITGDTPLKKSDTETLSLAETLERIRSAEPEFPSRRIASLTNEPHLTSLRTTREKLRQETIHDLDWIVSRALRIEPSERYATVDALAQDIRNYLEDRPVSARPPGAVYLARKFCRRNPVLVWSAALLLLVLLGGIAGTTYGLLEAQRATAIAEGNADREKAAKVEANRLRELERAARLESEQRRWKIRQAARVLQSVFEEINPEVSAAGNSGELRAELIVRLKKAAAEMQDADLAEDADVLVLKVSLAKTLIALGESSSAVPLVQNVIEASAANDVVQWKDRLALLATLGHAYRESGQIEKAARAFERTAELAEQHFPPDDPTRLATLNYLAVSQSDAGDHEAALRTINAVLGRLDPANPETSSLYYMALNQFALLKSQAGDDREAAEAFAKVLEHWSSVFPQQHPIVLQSRSNLALALDNCGDHRLAVENLREVLQGAADQFPAGSEQVGSAKINLAASLARSESAESSAEAARLLEEVASSGTDSATTFRARTEWILLRQREGADAGPLRKEAESLIAAMREKLGEEHPVLANSRSALASLLIAEERARARE